MDAQSWLEADVAEVPGVSGRAAATLRSAFEIRTVRDLLEHYPHQDKYRDIGAHVPLHGAPIGQSVTVVGAIQRWNVIRPRRRRMTIAKAVVRDDEGGRVEVPFFNQQWRPRETPEGTRVAVSGTLERFRGQLQMKNAKLVALGEGQTPPDEDRIQPTYPATEAMGSPRIAEFVRAALDRLPPVEDHLPPHLVATHGLLDLDTALRAIHRPPDLAAVEPARTRLVYDELLCLQVGLQGRRRRLESDAVGLDNAPAADGLTARLVDTLPFTPTGAQERALAELAGDLALPKPMHRLLQGDVGSGKTLVAAWALLAAVDNGRQAVIMAPTEVLAEQHLRTLTSLFAPLGVNAAGGPRLELVTGTTGAKRLRGVLAELAVGDIDLLVGTHALLEERVSFHDLGVVVIDEQHRFGVEHRTRLRDKRGGSPQGADGTDGRHPDVLVMTATPIPRSLALTLYGDLDVTVLDELPPGRQPVHTEVIDADSDRRSRLYDFIRERAAAGERAYVVCPLVEDSEALEDVASAESTYAHLAEAVFPELSVGLVHGRLSGAERDRTMEAFRAGDIQVLVATTVIEVGVDVPEATVMVIEDADRFGISQLHQLRGRVGRAAARSYCVLFHRRRPPPGGAAPQEGLLGGSDHPRLDALAATTDGFRLAEIDLELRGEGSLFDTRQSGLPDLRLARLVRDVEWVARSREDARALVRDDPFLHAHPRLHAEVARRYGEERLAALETG